MNALSEIKNRFGHVLKEMVEDPADLLEMIRPAQDSKFGDYQANCAMPMKNLMGKPPREIADEKKQNAAVSLFVREWGANNPSC